jgi:hypothetical protein
MALTDEDKAWISAGFSDLKGKIERLETSLLTEFHKWASPMDARMRTHNAAIRALDLEMESLNDRVKNLEQPPN